jgi:putative intracellular protease/amidase
MEALELMQMMSPCLLDLARVAVDVVGEDVHAGDRLGARRRAGLAHTARRRHVEPDLVLRCPTVGALGEAADAVRGRTLTSWPSLKTDLRNAGAEWVDQEVVVDRSGPGPLISSRKPDDLPAFNRALEEVF